MAPKVLILNPEFQNPKIPSGLVTTSWDEKSFWITESFSFSQVFSEDEGNNLSPFMLIDARLSFLLSLLDPQQATLLRGFPPLAATVFALRSKGNLNCECDLTKYWSEYSTQPVPNNSENVFSQVAAMTEISSEDLEKLTPQSTLYLAGFENRPAVIPGFGVENVCEFDEDSELGTFVVLKLVR